MIADRQTTWTLLLCEGAHDQAALAGWLGGSGWTKHEKGPRDLPPPLEAFYPNPKKDKQGRWRIEKAPDYLQRAHAWMEVRSLGGDSEVLGASARNLLGQVKDEVYAVGVFVDADGKGVSARLDAFRNAFRSMFAHVDQVQAGSVAPGSPRLGLWVAPDNRSPGAMSELLLQAGRLASPMIFTAAEAFARAVDPHLKEMDAEDRSKVLLGTAGQIDSPSAALATALRKGPWLKTATPAAQRVIDFIEQLVGDEAPIGA